MRRRLLIIDDDSRNIFALKAVLRSKQFECDSAQSAGEGIEKMKQTRYDAVLMDMMMPDMDGYEAIQLIQKDSRLKGIPIVSVTAQAMPGDKERCLSTGAVGYVSKPVDIDALLLLLKRIEHENT